MVGRSRENDLAKNQVTTYKLKASDQKVWRGYSKGGQNASLIVEPMCMYVYYR